MTACSVDGCRSHAMRGAAWCRSHHPGLPRTGGAPAGNRNARTHGLYARWFTPVELAELEAVSGPAGLTGEIAALRVAISRLLGDGAVSPADALVVMGRGVDSLGRALRNQRVLAEERSGALLDALESVLEELGIGTA